MIPACFPRSTPSPSQPHLFPSLSTTKQCVTTCIANNHTGKDSSLSCPVCRCHDKISNNARAGSFLVSKCRDRIFMTTMIEPIVCPHRNPLCNFHLFSWPRRKGIPRQKWISWCPVPRHVLLTAMRSIIQFVSSLLDVCICYAFKFKLAPVRRPLLA